jgi:hypothetical protein
MSPRVMNVKNRPACLPACSAPQPVAGRLRRSPIGVYMASSCHPCTLFRIAVGVVLVAGPSWREGSEIGVVRGVFESSGHLGF